MREPTQIPMKIKLKRVLSPKKPAHTMLGELIAALDDRICVQDLDGEILVGNGAPPGSRDLPGQRYAVTLEGTSLGWVIGPPQAEVIARLLNHLLQKEEERRGLGSELLDTYREVNLLYKLSERLTATIELTPVAEVALDEVRELLPGSDGAVLLLNDETGFLEAVAAFGKEYDQQTRIKPGAGLIGSVFESGKGEIVNEMGADSRFCPDDGNLVALATAPLRVKEQLIGMLVIGSRERIQYSAVDLKRLNMLAAQAAPAIENALMYARQVHLTQAYSRFVPPEFLQFLGKESIVDVELGDHVNKEMAIMVSDIRGFTSISEGMTPKENFEFINRYLAVVSPIIRKHHGFIVKYMGDGMMALFPRGILDAIEAALEKRRQVRKLNQENSGAAGPPLDVGVGLHTGKMMVGTVGETARMQGDIFSDAVNLTSRLEGLTKQFGVGIVISEGALALLSSSHPYDVRFLGKTRVKGRNERIAVYGIFDGNQDVEAVEGPR